MMMPGRGYNSGNYRYGFNGKENDNDVKGEGNQQDYGMRIYDPRISKFLSLDPLAKDYPFYTPYQFSGNSPIANIDLDGAEPKPAITGNQEGQFVQTSEQRYVSSGMGYGTNYTATKDWFWHGGGIYKGLGSDKSTGQTVNVYSRSGWYSGEDYRKTLQAGPNGGFAGQVAGYLGLYNNAAGQNLSAGEKSNFANTSTGKFIATLSKEGAAQLAAAAKAYAHQKNVAVSGLVEQSSFNVEDMVGLGLLLRRSIKALSSNATQEVILEGPVKSNYNRFLSKIPSNSKSNASFQLLDDGNYLFQATSPGKVSGSSAMYQKWVNPKGETFKMTKTTFAPDGSIIHVKPKL